MEQCKIDWMESATAMMAQSNNFPKDMLNILANLRR